MKYNPNKTKIERGNVKRPKRKIIQRARNAVYSAAIGLGMSGVRIMSQAWK